MFQTVMVIILVAALGIALILGLAVLILSAIMGIWPWDLLAMLDEQFQQDIVQGG